MSLLFNMLSRLVITFLPRSKRLFISWLQSPSAVILEPRKIKSVSVSPSICHEVMEPAMVFPVVTWCEELPHWKRPWCWEGLGAGGEGDDRGWDGWMELPTRWTWVWVNSGRWWWTERPGVLRFMVSQRVRHDWVTELNWTELKLNIQKTKIMASSSTTSSQIDGETV